MDGFVMGTGVHGVGYFDIRPGPAQLTAVARSGGDKGSGKTPSFCSSASSSKVVFNNHPLRSLLFGGRKKRVDAKSVAFDVNDTVLGENEKGNVGNMGEFDGQNGYWVLKILHVRSLWSSQKQGKGGCGGVVEERENEGQDGNFTSSSSSSSCGDVDNCGVCYDDNDDDDEKGRVELDRDTFSKMLKKVSLSEAKLYAQMSYLGSLAYIIPSIKPRNLLKRHGLRYVTSSIEKREQVALAEMKAQLANAIVEQRSGEVESKEQSPVEAVESEEQKNDFTRTNASAAIQIAASAASYLRCQTKNIINVLPLRSLKDDEDHNNGGHSDHLDINSEMASLMATTDSVTAVVAAKEEVKQAVADDLNSISSSPCEWYMCDDDKTATRYFVIQGSETLASWQANLLFEPVQFEGLDVLVHRGIYEAAKGMYQQMLPEILAYIKAHGSHAKFRFTGHSLGGSLSLLINLMLLTRGVVPYSSLLPVVTFGSPCIMCGGDTLLRKLGLPKSHLQAIVMHRDIVPRAFSCSYPRPAAELLKAVNGNFRNHPCLNSQKLLYAPMGEMLILQPDAKYSPQHDLLPAGSGLFLLTCLVYDVDEAEKLLSAAKNTFLNMPHPLEILSDHSAYGSGGTIQRDHDMNSYLKCLRGVIRQELSRIRKTQRERRKVAWWPLVTPRVVVGTALVPSSVGQSQFNFSGIVRTGKESLKRFSRLVTSQSQNMHLLVVLLFPVRMLLIGAYNVIGIR